MHLATRSALQIIAIIALAFGSWMFAANALRYAATNGSSNSPEAARSAAGWAFRAAQLGVWRSSLWRDAALAAQAAALPAGTTMEAASRAASLAPYSPQMWLLLSDVALRAGLGKPRAATFLRLSYLTGPNDRALMPARIRQFARLSDSGDPDIRLFAAQDFRFAAKGGDSMQAALVDAYRAAPSSDLRDFIVDSAGGPSGEFATNRLALPRK